MKKVIKLSAESKNTVNFINNTPIGYSIPKKTRQEINRENYFKHSEERKERARLRYAKSKEQERERVNNYSRASDYQVLISLKEYTELNSAKHKKWLDFVWTFKDLSDSEGHPKISNVIEIMRLRELAEILINDYWYTAKNEIKKGKSWNSLDQEQKDRLIKYLAREKAREEQGIKEAVEELERQGKQYEKEIEIAKFHEERGRIHCPCHVCENKKVVKAKIDKEFTEQEPEIEKGECCVCGKVRKLDEEGICKKCESQLE